MMEAVAPRYKFRQRVSRAWFYWFKKYRGTKWLDELEPLEIRPEWHRPGRYDVEPSSRERRLYHGEEPRRRRP